MAYEVRMERAESRPFASARDTVPSAQLGAAIRRLLDAVWPVIRAQGVRHGHNIVVYHGGRDGMLEVEAGVETLSDFEESGDVRRSATPAGEAITVAYFGDYSAMRPAYEALERWCADNERHPSGISWEVYGDWDDDPAKVRTDIHLLLDVR